MSDNPHENKKTVFEGTDINYAKSVMVLMQWKRGYRGKYSYSDKRT